MTLRCTLRLGAFWVVDRRCEKGGDQLGARVRGVGGVYEMLERVIRRI